jgi:hypothetical protein
MAAKNGGPAMTAMRTLVGEVLRARRISQGLTLRDVSGKARVSLG